MMIPRYRTCKKIRRRLTSLMKRRRKRRRCWNDMFWIVGRILNVNDDDATRKIVKCNQFWISENHKSSQVILACTNTWLSTKLGGCALEILTHRECKTFYDYCIIKEKRYMYIFLPRNYLFFQNKLKQYTIFIFPFSFHNSNKDLTRSIIPSVQQYVF